MGWKSIQWKTYPFMSSWSKDVKTCHSHSHRCGDICLDGRCMIHLNPETKKTSLPNEKPMVSYIRWNLYPCCWIWILRIFQGAFTPCVSFQGGSRAVPIQTAIPDTTQILWWIFGGTETDWKSEIFSETRQSVWNECRYLHDTGMVWKRYRFPFKCS